MKNDLLSYTLNTQWKNPLDSYHQAGTFDRCNTPNKMRDGKIGLNLSENKICYLGGVGIIMCFNNTPPATHKNSALRGVTCFWGTENG